MSSDKRVAVTGIGLRSPIGNSMAELSKSLKENRSGIVRMPEWEQVENLRTRVAGVCRDIDDKIIPRQTRRTMGPVAILACLSVMDAISDSGLEESRIASPACGVSFGSTEGSTHSQEKFMTQIYEKKSLKGMPSSIYLQFMSHTCASNIAMMFQTRGPVIASCTACSSGSQGIGFGYQEIKEGRASVMLCGGAEEMHFMDAAIFDIMRATSTKYNDRPDETPRPFDAERDGLVVGEGAACLVLEDYASAAARGARIYAEIAGFGTNCDGRHITNPCPEGMAGAMEIALRDAGIPAGKIDHINAHATATAAGDIAEAEATYKVFGGEVPVSGFKGYMGHTLGACGAIESIISIIMMREKFAAPTRNLVTPDPACAPIRHLMKETIDADYRITINNNFAFGGINTSLIFRKI